MGLDKSAQMISSLSKAVQIFCKSYIGSDTSIHVTGELSLQINKGRPIRHFLIDEKIIKTGDSELKLETTSQCVKRTEKKTNSLSTQTLEASAVWSNRCANCLSSKNKSSRQTSDLSDTSKDKQSTARDNCDSLPFLLDESNENKGPAAITSLPRSGLSITKIKKEKRLLSDDNDEDDLNLDTLLEVKPDIGATSLPAPTQNTKKTSVSRPHPYLPARDCWPPRMSRRSLETFVTQKGSLGIICDGFNFNKKNEGKNHILWGCSQGRSQRSCKAKIKTNRSLVPMGTYKPTHSHPPPKQDSHQPYDLSLSASLKWLDTSDIKFESEEEKKSPAKVTKPLPEPLPLTPNPLPSVVKVEKRHCDNAEKPHVVVKVRNGILSL